MPQVRFLRDFRSRHTNEAFYEAGQVATFSDEAVAGLLAEGVVVGVTPPPVSAPVELPPSTGDALAEVRPVKKIGRPKKVKASE